MCNKLEKTPEEIIIEENNREAIESAKNINYNPFFFDGTVNP